MRADEVSKILARIQLDDNREVDEEGVVLASWIEKIGDLPFDLAYEAVLMHGRESTEYLKAGHIRANVRKLRVRFETDARVAVAKLGAIAAPVITLDRVKFEEETQAAIVAERIRKGLDPATGKVPS